MVCSKDYETRHPQDFIRVRGNNTAVPWVRPEAADVFVPVTYICTTEGRTAIAGVAVAGCAIAGSYSGIPVDVTRAIAGIAIAGLAIAGRP